MIVPDASKNIAVLSVRNFRSDMTALQVQLVAICRDSVLPRPLKTTERPRIHVAWPIFMIGLGAVLTLAWTIFCSGKPGAAILCVMI